MRPLLALLYHDRRQFGIAASLRRIHRTNIFMNSSTVFVEGNASISTYQDAEGKTRSGLNVTQRMSLQDQSQALRQKLTMYRQHRGPQANSGSRAVSNVNAQ
jgi:hypothetical protein